MGEELSEIQERIYVFIKEYIEREGCPPTNREIGSKVGVASTGHIDYHLNALSKKGYIVRTGNKSRGIKLLKTSQKGLPVLGSIAAGQPLAITDEREEFLELSERNFSKEAYVLVVKGQSMIEDYIFDGDYIVVEPGREIANGDIVVATHRNADGERGAATVKRFYKEGGRIRLQPANSEMQPIYVDSKEWDSEWEIQGKVKAVLRQF